MTSVPPPPRQRLALLVVAGLGGAGAYGLQHLPDAAPWWVSLGLGCVFTGFVSLGWLYQGRPGA